MDNAGLQLDRLLDLPQVSHLRRAATRLWEREQVIAIWLGGSLAAGSADAYSDMEVRVAVRADQFDSWVSQREWLTVFDDPQSVMDVQNQIAADFAHHFVMLSNGDVYDLVLFNGAPANPAEHEILILGSRDDGLARRLTESTQPRPKFYEPAKAAVIRKVIGDFWLNSHKHRKVLARGLELLVLMGLTFDRERVVRLWHAAITGMDMGDARPSIHLWGRMMKAIQKAMGPRALQILGARCLATTALYAHRAITPRSFRGRPTARYEVGVRVPRRTRARSARLVGTIPRQRKFVAITSHTRCLFFLTRAAPCSLSPAPASSSRPRYVFQSART